MKFSTQPSHIYDEIFWPIIRLVWEPFSLKRSHWWHWIVYKKEITSFIAIPGIRSNTTRHQSFLGNFFKTNLGWKSVVVLSPLSFQGTYQRWFRAKEGDVEKIEICILILQGPVAALIGPYDTDFFAISYPLGLPITLALLEATTKDKLDKNTPII